MRVVGLFISVWLMMCLLACQTSPNDNDEHGNNGVVNVLEKTALTHTDFVLWLGRTQYDFTNAHQVFYHAASGFSVTFSGTSLTMTIESTQTEHADSRPYFTVLINDQSVAEGAVFSLSQAETTVVLATGLPQGTHTVTVLKRSEAQDALTAVRRLETDGTFETPRASFALNMLILGGSGISGNGVFGGPGIRRTTENSSALHAFGYKTADMLNANVQFVAGSGWGLKWGYNSTNASGTVNIRTALDVIGIDDREALVDQPFDLQSFIPDVILINLGGNDFNAHILKLSGAARTEAERTFQAAVGEIITYLHGLYPDALIVWTHTGSMNGTLAAAVISDLDPLRTFVDVVVIERPGAHNDPIGSGNHASETTHQRNADLLFERITTRLNEVN